MSAPRLGSAAAALALALASAGCSLLNAPDPDLLRDGGVDARVPDAGPPDADPLLDGCVPLAVTEDCSTVGVDDDCDGQVDCGDFDCAADRGCCIADTSREVTFTGSGWRNEPDAFTAGLMGGTKLTSFDGASYPRALVPASCTPLAVGVDFELTMQAPAGTCGVGADPAQCFGALVITPARTMVTGRRLLDDLAVTMNGRGAISVTQAGRELGSHAGFGTASVAIRIAIGPATDDLGRPALSAEVTARSGTGEEEPVLAAWPFLAQASLLDGVDGCRETPGLFVAVEGVGDAVHVGPLRTRALACVNPSHFQLPDRATESHLSHDQLGLGPWAQGGLAAPGLAGSREEPMGPIRWDLVFDTTDADRELERITSVGFAVGHALAPPGSWASGWRIPGMHAPSGGDCHPSCVGEPAVGCASACGTGSPEASYREPSILARTSDMGLLSQLMVAYAFDADGDGDFGLDWQPFSMFGAPVVLRAPAERFPLDPTCRSRRDPSLIPAGTDPFSGFWVFYTCVPETGPTTVRAARVNGDLDVVDGSDVEVISPAVGAYAEGGARAPEALVEYEPRPAGTRPRGVFRVWFTARDRGGGQTTVAMVQGQHTEAQASANVLPVFVPYPANPVLRVSDRALAPTCGPGGVADGMSECDLLGLAVAREAPDSNTLRFLVARRVNEPGSTRYELVPLEQSWRSPWVAPTMP